MAATVLGALDWSVDRDSEGHKDYSITWLCQVSDNGEGPATVLEASGLPNPGSSWSFGSDSDVWAYAWPDLTVEKHGPKNEQGNLWIAKQKFSTRPLPDSASSAFNDPLLQPIKTSGSFIKLTKQITYDRNGKKIANSAHELWEWEVDDNRPTVRIELNSLSLPLGTFAEMVDSLNDAPLWGVSARCVKLSNVQWERHAHQSYGYYYTVVYEFEINFRTFDLIKVDYGTKKLKSGGTSTNPTHFVVNKDDNGENTPLLLNGSGAPLTNGNTPFIHTFQHYPQANFLLLGVPSFL